jgi:hypothetical protein
MINSGTKLHTRSYTGNGGAPVSSTHIVMQWLLGVMKRGKKPVSKRCGGKRGGRDFG